jgi:hypothetical protein
MTAMTAVRVVRVMRVGSTVVWTATAVTVISAMTVRVIITVIAVDQIVLKVGGHSNSDIMVCIYNIYIIYYIPVYKALRHSVCINVHCTWCVTVCDGVCVYMYMYVDIQHVCTCIKLS